MLLTLLVPAAAGAAGDLGTPGNRMGNGGVTRLTLTDRSERRIRVKLTVREGTPAHGIDSGQLPFGLTLVMGRREGAGQRGECGETRFTVSECVVQAAGTRVDCRATL